MGRWEVGVGALLVGLLAYYALDRYLLDSFLRGMGLLEPPEPEPCCPLCLTPGTFMRDGVCGPCEASASRSPSSDSRARRM